MKNENSIVEILVVLEHVKYVNDVLYDLLGDSSYTGRSSIDEYMLEDLCDRLLKTKTIVEKLIVDHERRTDKVYSCQIEN